MIKSIPAVATLAAVSLSTLWAHHSFAAEYDASRLLVLTGTVVKFAWTNPHASLQLKVKNAHGNNSIWYLEMASPNSMTCQGWMPNAVKQGDVLTVEAYAAKDYATGGKSHRVKVPDGRWLFADSSGPNGPQPEVQSEK
jgi:hypothetical protein